MINLVRNIGVMAAIFGLVACDNATGADQQNQKEQANPAAPTSPAPQPAPPATSAPQPVPPAPAPTDPKDDCQSCAGDGKFDFHAVGSNLTTLNGHRVSAVAVENQAGKLTRPVELSGTITDGSFSLSCAKSLHENYQYPSTAAYVDVDGNGRCNAGDLGIVVLSFAWSADQSLEITPDSLQPVQDLSAPIGQNGTDFCGGYFF